jgi:cytochrome c oxidase cbb3-type subunit II
MATTTPVMASRPNKETGPMGILDKHKIIETNATLLLVGSVRGGHGRRDRGDRAALLPREHHRGGGGDAALLAARTAGRDIYIREGCYVCHSQMIRPMRDEVERYGHYSLAAESMYDHPFQWGSKRTGPDLARVGGRYSDEWHVDHLIDPQSVVPESIMPKYGFLIEKA